MIKAQRDFLQEAGVTFGAANNEIHFGVGKHSRIEMETPCELRAGRFDIDHIGAFSYLGGGNTVARNIASIGRFCAIGPNLFAGPVEHRTDTIAPHPIFEGNWRNKWEAVDQFYASNSSAMDEARAEHDNRCNTGIPKIKIGNNVWIGEGVFIKRGVTIGDGTIIAARSVIVKDVPAFTVVGGNPSKTIRQRYPDHIIAEFQRIRWWDYGLEAMNGVNFNSAESAICDIAANITNNNLQPMLPRRVVINEDQSCNFTDQVI